MRDDDTPCCEPKFWINLAISLALVAFSGLTSGLSIGLLSYSQVDLEVLAKAGFPKDKKNAAKILPIVKNECLLLCTLLIAKSIALETLPIFLDNILPFWAAILVSVTFVVAFAEVVPQAVCSRYGLSSGAKFVSFVRVLLFMFFPVAYPVSKLLDWLLGKGHSALLRRTELKTLVDLLSVKAGRGGDLTDDETTIITGALNMTEKRAKEAMTPISKTFSLDLNSKLDMYTTGAIVSRGHSRIPVYAGNPMNLVGIILVKNLIFCQPQDKIPIKDLMIRRIPRVNEDWPLYDILKLFQKGHSHMAVVVKSKTKPTKANEETNMAKEMNNGSPLCPISGVIQSPYLENLDVRAYDQSHPLNRSWEKGDACIPKEELESFTTTFSNEEAVGIITMEDLMEELLQEEILDETDHHVDIHRIRINVMTPRRLSSATECASTVSSPSYSPILRSPIPPFVPSPFIKPVLVSSPGKASLNPRGTPPSHQVKLSSRSALGSRDFIACALDEEDKYKAIQNKNCAQ